MTEFKLVMPINCYNEEHKNKVYETFSDFTLKWAFEDLSPCIFKTNVSDIPRSTKDEEWDLFPVEVSFSCNVEVTFSKEHDIFWLDSDENIYDEWDEFHYFEIRRLYSALVLSIVLSHPELNIVCAPILFFVDGHQRNKDLCINYPIQNDCYRSYPHFFASTISLQTAFDWLVTKTGSFRSKEKPMSSISALSYILNRDIRETLVYACIGLESLYVPEARNERQRLKQRISSVFPLIPTEEKINRMYTLRSKFVHGEYSMGVYPLMTLMPDDEEREVEQIAQFSIAILIESIRLLISHDATRMKFSETTTYTFPV